MYIHTALDTGGLWPGQHQKTRISVVQLLPAQHIWHLHSVLLSFSQLESSHVRRGDLGTEPPALLSHFCCQHHRHLPLCPTAPSPDPTRRCDQLWWRNTRCCWLVSSPLPGKAAQPHAVATAFPKELCLWCIFMPASVLTFLQTFKWPSGKIWRLGSSAPSPTVPRSQDPPFYYFPGVFLFSISACRAAWDFKKKCLPH